MTGPLLRSLGLGESLPKPREILENLSAHEKEAALVALHGTVLGLAALGLRSKGLSVAQIMFTKPALLVAGVGIGYIYYNIVSHILESSEQGGSRDGENEASSLLY